MEKRLFRSLLCFSLTLALLYPSALAADGTVTLLENKEIDETIIITADTTYDLAGFTLSLKSGASGNVFIVKAGATLTITDSSAGKTGKITGGKALSGDRYETDEYGFNRGEYRDYTDGCGGGVYVESGAKLVMTGGTVTGNRAEQGGGVYLESGAKLCVSGAASVTGNHNGASGAAADNVFLPLDASNNQSVITVTAALDAGARIGVTPAIRAAAGEVPLTSGLKDNGTKNNFTSDEGKFIYLNANGEAVYTATQRVHSHSFAYAADGAVITATCSKEDCTLPGSQATITIVKPALTVYGGSNSASATVERSSTDVAEPTVAYQSGGIALQAAPTNAGTYTASITLGGNTASVTYTIDKAAPTAAAPTGLTATYGQKLSEVALNNPDGNTPGTWAWADENASVGDAGSHTFQANFTPGDTANYHAATNIDVSLTVNKADASEAMKAATASLRARAQQTATVSYTLPDGASYGAVTNSNTEFFTVDSSNGLVLTAAKEWTASEWAESDPKSFTVAVNGATNYENFILTVTVTPTFKNTQEITAANVTAAYGGTGATVNAITTGNGAISYAVKEGYGEYIDVNPTTGALTLKKAGTAYVAVTAGETDDYAAATKDVTVTVNRASLTVKAKDQSIYVGGTIPSLEGADFYTVTGLVGSDTLMTPPTLAYQKEGVGITPVNNAVGTYDIVPSGANAGENYAITYQAGSLTVANRPSSSARNKTTVSVPAFGGKEAANMTVQINGSTAAITGGNMDKVLTAENVDAVTIDVSGINKDITAVSIPTETVKAVEKAVGDPSKDASALTVKLTDGSVTFDATALAAIVEQVEGSTLRLDLNSVGESMLNAAQKTAVDGLNVQEVLDVYLVSNGERISDFRGGRVTVTVSYALKKDQTGRGIVVWYVAGNGEKTEVPSSYSDQTVRFTVGHFSNYVITYDAGRTTECPQDETCPISRFVDANATAWYHDGVHWALENEVMNGVSPKYFNPNGETTRAMVVTMLWRMEGSPAQAGAAEFADVDGAQWYAQAVRWANANGIVEGYRDANGKGQVFNPNGAVTREQLATMLYRYAQYKKQSASANAGLGSFNDAASVSDWATGAMQWAVGSGVISGTQKGTRVVVLDPQGSATRAQVATMLMRYSTSAAK